MNLHWHWTEDLCSKIQSLACKVCCYQCGKLLRHVKFFHCWGIQKTIPWNRVDIFQARLRCARQRVIPSGVVFLFRKSWTVGILFKDTNTSNKSW